ncbi:MAG: tagatose-6-phosphate kinase [Eubacteriaceae bacterium]|jgi:tagatose 6-phosphate kinase
MIITVTMNPSIDISYPLETLKIDTVNRAPVVSKTAGGKGLNVTRVLHELGAPVIAAGVLGGHHGAFIADQLTGEGIDNEFTPIDGETRDCIAILHEGKQTEILEAGPEISEEETDRFIDSFEELLGKADLVTMSGSLPRGIPKDFYSRLIEQAGRRNVGVLLDTSGESLKAALDNPVKPLLIKPNTEEISDLLGIAVDETDMGALKARLNDPVFDGVEWIVVSLGANGAFARHQDRFYKVSIPKIDVVNPVGSGDSTIAGLAYALDKHLDDADVLKTAMVCGMLNAQEKITGHINIENFEKYISAIRVELFE